MPLYFQIGIQDYSGYLGMYTIYDLEYLVNDILFLPKIYDMALVGPDGNA